MAVCGIDRGHLRTVEEAEGCRQGVHMCCAWPHVLLSHTHVHVTFDQDVILVTGAAMGIGRLMALRFASLGASLVLWDIDGDGLQKGMSFKRIDIVTASILCIAGFVCFVLQIDCSCLRQLLLRSSKPATTR